MLYFDELDSTNNKVWELGEAGAPHMTAVMAEKQTAGKGRRGRTWESPGGENIYLSVLLRPTLPPEKASMLTLVIGYSIARVLRAQNCGDVEIKWPNDLVLSGKKICGILTEMHVVAAGDEESSTRDGAYFVVTGFGINVNQTAIREELRDRATSLRLETGRSFDRRQLAEEILAAFRQDYEAWEKAGNLSPILEPYNALLVNRERTVRVLDPRGEYEAFALGITPEGELVVRLADGSRRKVYAGEVSVRGVLGYV